MIYKKYHIERVEHIWEDNEPFYNYEVSAYSPEFGCMVVFGYADTIKEAKKAIDTKNFSILD